MDPNTQQPNVQPAAAPVQPAPAAQPAAAPINTPPPKKNNSLLVVLGLVIIMAILLGGVYFYVIQSSTKKTSEAPAQAAPTVVLTATPTPEVLGNEENELKIMTDVGDPTQDLNGINQDLQQL